MRCSRIVTATLSSVAVGAAVLAPGAASAHEEQKRVDVSVRDDCHAPTFNAVLGDGACVGGGGTTFDEFLDEFRTTGDVHKWRFNPDDVHLDLGQGLRAVNRGGEFHTFTEVAQFGGGCIEELNGLLGLTPVPECDIPGIFQQTGRPAGATLDVPAADQPALLPGLHKYICLVHPWMRTVAVVEDD